MNHIRNAVIILLCFYLASCADSHHLVRLSGDSSTKLDKNGAVYVSISKDGIYGNNYYRGSGQNTAQIIIGAFAKMIREIHTGRDYENFNTALESARKNNAKYLVFPTILHWEDRATEWSSIPDKVEVRIEIVTISDGKTISSSILKGKSGIATFGGDHPQDLLPKPIEQYISSLY